MRTGILNKNKKKPRQMGISTVEMSFVVILFFILILGIIDFAFLMYNKQVITNAAREAARFGIVARPLIKAEDGTIALNERLTKDEIIEKAKYFAEYNVIFMKKEESDFNVQVEYYPDVSQNTCENFQDELEVIVECNYSFIFLPYDLDPIQSRAVMLCE